MWLTWQDESQDTVKDFVLVPYPLEKLPLTGRIHQHPTQHEVTSRSQMGQSVQCSLIPRPHPQISFPVFIPRTNEQMSPLGLIPRPSTYSVFVLLARSSPYCKRGLGILPMSHETNLRFYNRAKL